MGVLEASRQRFTGKQRRTEQEIKSRGANRQEQQAGDSGGAPPPQRRGRIQGRLGLRRFARGDEATRHFDARSLSLALADQASGAVADDLIELVAVDGEFRAAARFAAAR